MKATRAKKAAAPARTALEIPRFERIADDGSVVLAGGSMIRDTRTGLIWTSDNVGKGQMTWKKAKAACAKLDLGGFDWRLPTVEELFCLADRTKVNPAIDARYFTCESRAYWTSTLDASSPSDYAWSVYFYNGYAHYSHQHYEFFVRAVRAGQ